LACCLGARLRLALGAARGGAPFRQGVSMERLAGVVERFPESARSARPESIGERSEPGARKAPRSTRRAPTSS
jgi:hypothetical protein